MKRAVANARREMIARIFRFDRRRHIIRAAQRLERRVMASGKWDSYSHSEIQRVIGLAVARRDGKL